MSTHNRKKLLLTSAIAIVMSIASTAAIASAMSYEDDDDNVDVKSAACRAIGCPNGNRVCGSTTGTIKAGIPPFVGEVSVSYTCYESAPLF